MAYFKNEEKGARGIMLRSGGYLMVEPGKTAKVARAAVKALAGGLVEVDGDEVEALEPEPEPEQEPAGEPGPLDSSIADLSTYLAGIDDADEVQRLIDAETAGKSRKGALDALEARRDEILAA